MIIKFPGSFDLISSLMFVRLTVTKQKIRRMNQLHMDSDGNMDRTRGGIVGKSKRKQKKAFVDAFWWRNQTSFPKDGFSRISDQLGLPLNDFWQFIEELRYCDQPTLWEGQDGMFYVI